MEIKVKVRRWGSSMGVILPKSVVEANRIKDNDEITLEIKKQTVANELFGKYPITSGRTTQEIKDEMKKGWE